ncbi:MAG TPA: rRNA maturation RNase YbeY [Planctomycetota bacterium]
MISIANEQRRVPIPEADVRRVARRLLKGKSLSIAFVTDAAIRRVNRRFLGHDWATDVISFPLGTDLLGELVISAPYARAEARKRGISEKEELLRYVIHGILHLQGYDDHAPADRKRMWARQEREVERESGIRNPEARGSRKSRIRKPGNRKT